MEQFDIGFVKGVEEALARVSKWLDDDTIDAVREDLLSDKAL